MSAQDIDEKTGDLTTKQALVKAAQANVDRLLAMKSFTRMVAPFDGIITARKTDVGALINVGGGAGQELFVISDVKAACHVSVPRLRDERPPDGHHDPGRSAERTYTATVEASAQAVSARWARR